MTSQIVIVTLTCFTQSFPTGQSPLGKSCAVRLQVVSRFVLTPCTRHDDVLAGAQELGAVCKLVPRCSHGGQWGPEWGPLAVATPERRSSWLL